MSARIVLWNDMPKDLRGTPKATEIDGYYFGEPIFHIEGVRYFLYELNQKYSPIYRIRVIEATRHDYRASKRWYAGLDGTEFDAFRHPDYPGLLFAYGVTRYGKLVAFCEKEVEILNREAVDAELQGFAELGRSGTAE